MGYAVKIPLFDDLIKSAGLKAILWLSRFPSLVLYTYLYDVRNDCIAELAAVLREQLGKLVAFCR
jgi:hypothetical protein